MPKFNGLNHKVELDNQLDLLEKTDSLVGKLNNPAIEISKISDMVASSAGMDPIKNAVKAGSGIEELSVSKIGLVSEMLKQCEEITSPATEAINDLGKKNRLLKELSKIPYSTPQVPFRAPPFLQGSPKEEKTMKIELDSKEYKDLLRQVEELSETGDWVRNEVQLFCKGCEVRKERLLSAICNGKISFQPKEKGLLKDWSDESQEHEDDWRKCVFAYISGSLDRKEHLLLNAKSFLAWLKQEYPYEGEEPKENDSAPSLSPKRESNLLKIIGGFVQIVYLQKDSGKFWKGEKREQPNISAIAGAFQDELTKAGYSDDGFKDRHLRNIISDALEQIKENKRP